MDRKDLAIDFRIRLGDWFRVVQLIKSSTSGGASGDDVLLERAWNNIGDYYFERHRYAQAVTYFVQGRNTDKLVEVYGRLEDYENLEKLVETLPDHSPYLEVTWTECPAMR
jgi:WD repeat-containing protein 35